MVFSIQSFKTIGNGASDFIAKAVLDLELIQSVMGRRSLLPFDIVTRLIWVQPEIQAALLFACKP